MRRALVHLSMFCALVAPACSEERTLYEQAVDRHRGLLNIASEIQTQFREDSRKLERVRQAIERSLQQLNAELRYVESQNVTFDDLQNQAIETSRGAADAIRSTFKTYLPNPNLLSRLQDIASAANDTASVLNDFEGLVSTYTNDTLIEISDKQKNLIETIEKREKQKKEIEGRLEDNAVFYDAIQKVKEDTVRKVFLDFLDSVRKREHETARLEKVRGDEIAARQPHRQQEWAILLQRRIELRKAQAQQQAFRDLQRLSKDSGITVGGRAGDIQFRRNGGGGPLIGGAQSGPSPCFLMQMCLEVGR